MIRSHSDWIFIGVFYDVESGLRRRSGITGLDKMLRKVAKGKIDYIITKSISRVSRDTLLIDFLKKSPASIAYWKLISEKMKLSSKIKYGK